MDLATFQKFVFSTKNKLFRFALKLLGSSDEANDIVQEVLVKVWNSGKENGQIRNLEAWCMQITKNASLDRLRYLKKVQKDYVDSSDLQIPATEPSPLKNIELKDSMNRISEIMNGLSINQRSVMHLRDIEGYSYQEIGQVLGLSMSQVKVNLFRARTAVKEQLLKLNSHGL